jgi:nucleoside-diphosphate-sugar epimerase
MLSKTLAEEAAWKFAKEKGIDVVTINPGLVIGPLLQPTLNTSVAPVLKLINGTLKQVLKSFNHSDLNTFFFSFYHFNLSW